VLLSIVLAVLAATQHRGQGVDTSLVGKTTTAQEQPAAPAQPAANAAAPTSSAPAGNQSVPLQ
jgi:hypothetical protein